MCAPPVSSWRRDLEEEAGGKAARLEEPGSERQRGGRAGKIPTDQERAGKIPMDQERADQRKRLINKKQKWIANASTDDKYLYQMSAHYLEITTDENLQ
ncbi:hypothetical protein chiPu_0006694 [Chiloscyllium punctatum]|uniref:Uncharacterized protein n=1 Tax=Chiloscyllium punctatum TaxID=137246 RepID=A0A401SCZ6_CHIPU|nr:hypothetical protein [Chiloscyllium punctatum]